LRKLRIYVASAVVVLLVVFIFHLHVGSFGVHSPSDAGASVVPTSQPGPHFYLDIGASSSKGVQPDVHGNTHYTDTGYSNDLVTIEAAKGLELDLNEIGCPGENVQSMLSISRQARIRMLRKRCYHSGPTQLTLATRFLQAHHSEIGVVTIDLGFNNLRVCLSLTTISPACLKNNFRTVRQDLPKILANLESAAGPDVHFVGLEYGDPFLADYFNGPSGIADATETLTATTAMNSILAQAYGNAHMAVAQVSQAFDSANTNLVTLADVGTVPENVKQVCLLTWICTPAPYGPDDHPNNAGYIVIAQAIAAVLPSSL
jgi:lysophospholipase L1-like esterase